MNARERAQKVVDTTALSGWQYDVLIAQITQTIVAAEEAKAREVREACAMIIQKVYERELASFANLKEYTDAPHIILEDLINQIRARSEGKKKET